MHQQVPYGGFEGGIQRRPGQRCDNGNCYDLASHKKQTHSGRGYHNTARKNDDLSALLGEFDGYRQPSMSGDYYPQAPEAQYDGDVGERSMQLGMNYETTSGIPSPTIVPPGAPAAEPGWYGYEGDGWGLAQSIFEGYKSQKQSCLHYPNNSLPIFLPWLSRL